MENKRIFVLKRYSDKIIYEDFANNEILDFLDSTSHVTITDDYTEFIPAIIFKKDSVETNDIYSSGQLEERSLLELTSNVLVEFAKWIDNSDLHGWSKQVREAMIVYKINTIEELVQYFINNIYKSE